MDVETYFQSYSMQILGVDLVWERPGIDGYEDANTVPPLGFWQEMIHIFGFPKKKGISDA
ncbi:unnamed protein product [Clonostachys chloroleuca]|uniref:Uncharacterized protein n=1 Tax=Clonostachys chloroleuca TaxID=1926264 RepID=A0AA35Q5B0_9HYPO|nr:unnamed protein product [Clonostachys chloroleuca]